MNPCHVPLGHRQRGVASVKPHGSDSSGNFVPFVTVEPEAAALAASPLAPGEAGLRRPVQRGRTRASRSASGRPGLERPLLPASALGLFFFFSPRRIRAGTELTWDYNYEVGSVEGKELLCCCGAIECRGRLL